MISTLAASLLALPFVSAVTHTVVVGGEGILLYTPEWVAAEVGDVVRFEFHQKNHTATQSSFASPCTPLQDSYGAPVGFNSGFQPVPPDQTSDFPYWDVPITHTDPIWFYCQQATHCQQGMVGAINPPPDTFDAFKQAATGSAAVAPSSTNAYPSPTSYNAYPSPTASGPVEHHIIVGGPGKLLYEPSNIAAAVGDKITFEFRQKNHTVTQSSFDNPCRKLEFTSPTGQVGFDSGFNFVADGATEFPTYTITVNDTAPIWAYCRQTNHCGSGMVFAANAVESGPNNFQAFVENAKRLNGTTANPTGAPAAPSGVNDAASTSASVTMGVFIVAGMIFMAL